MQIRVRRRMKQVGAMQFDGSAEGAQRLAAFAPGVRRDGTELTLPTARGPLRVYRGDWLVQDPDTLDVAVVSKEQFFRDYDHVSPEGDAA